MSLGQKLGLWRKVTSDSHPKRLIEYDLEESKEEILLGTFSYDKPRSEKSLKALKAKKYARDQLNCILELSEVLGLDELSCDSLYTEWLINEYRDTPDNLKACLSDERSRYHLLKRLVSFYYTDRIYSHLTLKEIVSRAHDQLVEYQQVYANFLEGIAAKSPGKITKLLASEYECLYNKEPRELYDSALRHLMTAEHQSAWCYQMLKEQVIVLETLLIHQYHQPTCDAFHLLDLLSKLKSRALTGQPHTAIKHLITDLHRPLLLRLEQLQVLLLLVCMKLDVGKDGDHPLTLQQDTLSQLDNMFVNRLGEFSSHAPLLLGWAVIRCGALPADTIGKMGDTALRLNVLPYMLTLLESLEPQELSNELSVVTIYHLVSRMLSLFDDSAMDEDDTITSIICQLLEHQPVADNVIQAGDTDALYRYMLSALQSFPLNFHSSLNMMAAMAKSSKAAAIHVVQWLLAVPAFTEYLDSNSQVDVQFLTDNQVELTTDRPLFGNVLLPAGTLGFTADSEGPPTVRWNHSYNVWQLLSYELATVCSQPHLVADVVVQRRLLTSTKLMAATFKHAPISGDPAEMIHDSLYRIIHGLSVLESPPLEVLSSCIDLCTSIVHFTPTRVLDNLAVVFFPYFTSINDDFTRPWEAQMERSLFGHVIYSAETVQSRYPVLISTLKLICVALETTRLREQNARQRLLAVTLFVCREVLTSFNTWRYVEVQERDFIAELSLEIIHAMLNGTSECEEDELSQAGVQTLLHTNSCQTLMDMISFGSELLDIVVLEQASVRTTSCLTRHGKPSTVYRLYLCLSLLRRLLVIAHGTKEETLLESNLSSKATHGQRHITRVMASYTYHRHSDKLAIISTQLLNVVAQESAMSLLSSFGEDAYAIRCGLLRRLALRAEEPRCKVVLVEFLTTCVENQPGLLELFLSTNTETEEPLLTVTQQLIESKKQLTHLCPGDLLLASLNFILALWSAGREKVTQQLATSESFWTTVVTSFTKHLGDLGSGSLSHPVKAKIYCNVLQLLSYQLYQRNERMKEFNKVISSITQPQWVEISKFVHEELQLIGSMSAKDNTLHHSAAIHLLDSHRMFLSSAHLAKKNVFDAATCLSMMEDVLGTLSQLVSGEVTTTTQRLASMLSSMYFELISNWHGHLSEWTDSYNKLAQVLHSATNGGSDMNLPPSALIGILASLQQITRRKVKRMKTKAATSEATESVLTCICSLLPAVCSQLSSTSASVSQQVKVNGEQASLEKLRVVLLSALFSAIQKLPETVWVPRLHESYIIPSLLGSMAQSIKTRTDLPYVESCTALLTKLSAELSTSQLISPTLSEHLTLNVSALYDGGSRGGGNKGSPENVSWQKVSAKIVEVYSFLLKAQAHAFVSDAATFIAVHSDRILLLMEMLSVTLSEGSMSELRSYVHLLCCLSKHQHQWITESSSARVRQLLGGVCYLAQDCVALLHRPKAIEHILLKQMRNSQKKAVKVTDLELSHTRQSLLDILSECSLMMKSFSPELTLLLNDVTLDVGSYEPLVNFGFTSPSLETRAPPTFGSLISTTSLCISLLTKSERSPSRSQLSDEEVEIIRPRLLYILEVNLYLILTQVMLHLRVGVLGQKETNLLKREIGTELNACILGIQRYYRKITPASPGNRGGTTPTVNSTPSSSRSPRRRSLHSPAIATVLAENRLYKLAEQFVKTILK